MDEFEEVETKKRKDTGYDDDSYDEVPKALMIEVEDQSAYTREKILEGLDLIPEDKRTAIIKDNLQKIKSLWDANRTSHCPWRVPREFEITCLDVGRDEDIWDESDLAATFQAGKMVHISSPALLLVPGKALIALTLVDD